MKSPKVKVIVLRTAGTNCDWETAYAFEKVGATVSRVHVNEIVRREKRLSDYQILAIPGGFSYGDDLGAGKVLANELITKLAEEFWSFVRKDHLVIGICNGFQVLVKMNLLPGLGSGAGGQEATLSWNDSGRYEDRWVWLSADSGKAPFVRKGDRIYLPVAHAEGKFITRDEAVLKKIRSNGQVVFRYVGKTGKAKGFPENPNGSVDDIAGICDPTGRVLGLMPHPERHVEPTQHPQWTRLGARGLAREGDGVRIFRNAIEYFK